MKFGILLVLWNWEFLSIIIIIIMYKHLFRAMLWLIGLMGTLSLWVVNAQSEPSKDIVIEATATEANQTLTINKYFANAYTVSRCDGCETSTLSSDTWHTYEEPWTYTITLSLTGWATRWTFQNVSKPLVPQNGTTMTWVKIAYMPSLADWFGTSSTTAGNYFFYNFNRDWALTSLLEWSFDTSKITTVWNYFFDKFNNNWKLTSLPDNSFRLSTWLTTVWDYFFDWFNGNWVLTSLPTGSFDTSKITTVGIYFFSSFNRDWALISLPDNSFQFPALTTAGGSFLNSFNSNWQLKKLPDNSFQFPALIIIENAGFWGFNSDWQLKSLPDNSFQFPALITAWNNFFWGFNSNWQLKNLPDNSFQFPLLTTAENLFFQDFNNNWQLTSLPEWSFDTSKITTVWNNFFYNFNNNWKLTSLPTGSFDISKITTVGHYFFANFNNNWQLTSLPEWSFDTSKITTVWNNFFWDFNSNWQLTSLPTGSFNTSKITTAWDSFFSYFNYNWKITTIPDSLKLTSAAYNQINGYQQAFYSPSYTLNKKVSDLVSWATAPSSHRNTFSYNQPWRCGVDAKWLASTANACHIRYDANGWVWSVTWWYVANATGVVAWSNITVPTRNGYKLDWWYTAPEWWELVETITFPDMDENTLYAHWTETKEYTITFNASVTTLRDEDGNIPESNTITYTPSDDITLYTNQKNWYTFNWWDVDVENSSWTWLNITDTITDMHIWSWHTWNVALNYNSIPQNYQLYIDDSDCDISANTFTVIYGKALNAEWTTLAGQNSLPIPTKTGYTFKWYSKEEWSTTLLLKLKSWKVSPNIVFNDWNFEIDHDNKTSTIYPVFNVKPITIVLHDPVWWNSNIPNNTYGSTVILPDPESDVYIFDGWY